MRSFVFSFLTLVLIPSISAQDNETVVSFQGKIVPVQTVPKLYNPHSRSTPVFTDEVELHITEGGNTMTDYTYFNMENPANALDWGWLVSSATGNLFLTSPLVSDGISFTEVGFKILTTVDSLQSINGITVGASPTQGELEIMDLTVAGLSTSLCIDAAGPSKVGRCTSSARFKQDVTDLSMGLQTLQKLRPVTFRWNENDESDLGFLAEEVADVEPLLATFDESGSEVGVKYRRMTALLVKSIQELSAIIEHQGREITHLKETIEQKRQDDLKKDKL